MAERTPYKGMVHVQLVVSLQQAMVFKGSMRGLGPRGLGSNPSGLTKAGWTGTPSAHIATVLLYR